MNEKLSDPYTQTRSIQNLKQHRIAIIFFILIATIALMTFSLILETNYIAIGSASCLLIVSICNYITIQKRINSASTRM